MDLVRVLRELRLGLAELNGVKATAFWLIAAVFVLLVAGRWIFIPMSFFLSIR